VSGHGVPGPKVPGNSRQVPVGDQDECRGQDQLDRPGRQGPQHRSPNRGLRHESRDCHARPLKRQGEESLGLPSGAPNAGRNRQEVDSQYVVATGGNGANMAAQSTSSLSPHRPRRARCQRAREYLRRREAIIRTVRWQGVLDPARSRSARPGASPAGAGFVRRREPGPGPPQRKICRCRRTSARRSAEKCLLQPSVHRG
jgi:hypothetical protein